MESLYPYLSSYLEEHGINPKNHFSCLNPSHKDSSPSCSIAPSGNAFHCFGCGTSGGIFHAAHFLENKPMTGPEFIHENLLPLAKKYEIEIESEPLTEEEIYELDTFKAYKAAAHYILNSPCTDMYKQAVAERGWTIEQAQEFGIGCVADYKEFRQVLKDMGFHARFLDDVDLGRTDVFGPDRMIYTIKDEHGKPVGFSSRNLNYNGDKSNGSKYVNQKGTGVKCNIYKKSTRLFGFDQVLKHSEKKPKPIYIFEGYSDVVSVSCAGIRECVAIGGLALTYEQLFLLKEHGYYEIILCLDGDAAGQDKVIKLLDTVLSGHKDLHVKIVSIPNGKDPDEFVRENGIEEFKQLKQWTAFEWRLAQFPENSDPEVISASMIPLIVNETSFITQEKMSETLSRATGITQKTIQAELNRIQNLQELEKSRDRKNIIEKMVKDCQRDSSSAEFAIHEANTRLYDLSRRYEIDSFSEEACLSMILNQKNVEEAKDGKFSGYVLGPELAGLQNALCGKWRQDVWFCIGGRPNCGKTSFMCKLAYEIANHEIDNDACVIYHSIDDTAEQILPKYVSIAEGSRKLTLNQTSDPNYHARNRAEGGDVIKEKRETGYQVLMNLVRNGRLVIKDANNGNSIAYADRLITYYKEKYPSRNIVYILDNFHKLQDFSSTKGDERTRFKELSTVVKGLATRHHIAIITTVEYRKTQDNKKATNQDISETIQIEYDANLIAHIHNDLHDRGDKAEMYHLGEDDDGDVIRMPTIEMDIGKNKVTGFKNKLYFDFYPSCSDFIGVASDIATARMNVESDDEEDSFYDKSKYRK